MKDRTVTVAVSIDGVTVEQNVEILGGGNPLYHADNVAAAVATAGARIQGMLEARFGVRPDR
jgi:hypothetical protein